MNLTPMESRCWSCFARGRGLVNGSDTFRTVCFFKFLCLHRRPFHEWSWSVSWCVWFSCETWIPLPTQLLQCFYKIFSLTQCTGYYTQIGYELLHLDSFMCCFSSSYVLRFTRRSRHDALLGTASTDNSTIQYKYIYGLRLIVIWIDGNMP